MRVPKHIAIIPDGNRRWAKGQGYAKQEGYNHGLNPGLEVLRLAKKYGISEITYYGFTMDNCKRPKEQVVSFTKACVAAVQMIQKEDVGLLVVGNTKSQMFPEELIPYTKERTSLGENKIKVNFLVNYGWEWDLRGILERGLKKDDIHEMIYSYNISRIDLIIRWGGHTRLSGLLPVQAVYADFYTIDKMWPEFEGSQFEEALKWYSHQDVTLGG